jgi:hypothetical protein
LAGYGVGDGSAPASARATEDAPEWRSLVLYRHKLIERRKSVHNEIHSIVVTQGKTIPGRRSVWSDDSMSQLAEFAKPLSECATTDELWHGHLKMKLDHLNELCQHLSSSIRSSTPSAKPMCECDD